MADASPLKKASRSSLGAPPSMDAVQGNLQASEVAPPAREPTPAADKKNGRVDGRTARRTGRTIQFSTRVTEAFDKRFRGTAAHDKLLFGELLEKALDAYDAQKREANEP